MRAFRCPTCGSRLFFENDTCLACATPVGFDPARFELVAVADGRAPWWCANRVPAGCNWVVEDPGLLCRSCALTRTRPPDDDAEVAARFVESEAAKRRLVAQLVDLDLPLVSFRDDEEAGLGFDLVSGRFDPGVVIGHQEGLVTLDVDEADPAHRERVREELGEPYRTVLGHLRHEVGHHYWDVLVGRGGPVDRFRERFGDERADYAAAIEAHYQGPPPVGWEATHVSAYATMHPWEDWAETFAHYLHLRDTLQTARASGVEVARSTAAGADGPPSGSFAELVDGWVDLTTALNLLNRSMGARDLYPFVLAPAVVDKLAFVDSLVRGDVSGRGSAPGTPSSAPPPGSP